MMDFRVLKPAERNYTYSQSQQISMQTGCIGHYPRKSIIREELHKSQ